MRAVAAATLALVLGGCTVGELLGLKPFEPNRSNPQVERLAREVMQPPRQSAADLLQQGDRLRDNGDVAQAALSYLKAMRLDPTQQAPGERIGFMHLAKGDAERAEASFNTVLNNAPDSPPALVGRGLAQLRKREFDAARASLERAMALDPMSELAALAMGLLCDWTDRPDEARRHYSRAIELAPVSADAENNMGVSYFLSGDHAQAVEHLRRAVQLDPKDAAYHNNFALALAELGRFDEALLQFRAAGSEAVAQNNLGYVHYRRGNYPAAIQHFELALVAAPSDPLPIIRNLRRAQDDLDRSRAAPPVEGDVSGSPAPAP